MRVLVACEYSGRVRNAFAALGHDVISADFEPSEDGSPYHYQGDVFDLLAGTVGLFDLMIAHPPCTYLSVSGMHWTTRGLRDPQLTEDALAFVKRLMDVPIPRICIENPVSIISTRIRPKDQSIQPWQFGDDASKTTWLWLKNLPKMVIDPAQAVPPRITPEGKKRWGNQTDSGQNRLGPSADRWKERSRTYPGIARAFAEQWGEL